MKLGIVTDSTCDIPQFLIEQHELDVIPCILVIDGKEYVDGKDITREEFYRQLPSRQAQPTTSRTPGRSAGCSGPRAPGPPCR